MVAHVAEILGDGDAGVDAGLTGGHGHIGGVGDQNGALHQCLAGAGVGQLRELPQHVGHLVAALAAADVDHDVHVGPLGQLVLHHGLAGAEGTGHGGGAALGDGEHGVDDALAGLERCHRRELLLIGTADADGPLLHHGQLPDLTLVGADLGDHVLNGVAAFRGDPLHGAADAVGHHDLVEDGAGLRHGAQHVAADDLVARLSHGGPLPLLVAGQRGHLDAAGDVGAHPLDDLLQRALDAVVDVLDQAGTQLHAQRRAGGHHVGAGAQAGGLLIDLDGGALAGHIQDLADQTLGTYADDVGHIGVGHAVRHHQRAGYFDDLSHILRCSPFKRCLRPRRAPPRCAAPPRPDPGNRSCRGSE